MNNYDDHIWAANKIEEITAPMYDDEHYFAMFQAEEQQRIWDEYQATIHNRPADHQG